MRLHRVLVLACLCLTLGSAEAKNNNGNNKGVENSIQTTGVKSFDKVFNEAAAIDTILDDARRSLKSGRTNLATALDLPKGTPLQDSLDELKKRSNNKLKVANNSGKLRIEAKDGVPTNVQSGIDAVNGMLEGYENSVKALASLPDQIQSVQTETQSLIGKLDDPSSLGLSLVEAPGVLKKSKNNLEMISKMPNRVDKLSTELGRNTKLVATTLKPN